MHLLRKETALFSAINHRLVIHRHIFRVRFLESLCWQLTKSVQLRCIRMRTLGLLLVKAELILAKNVCSVVFLNILILSSVHL